MDASLRSRRFPPSTLAVLGALAVAAAAALPGCAADTETPAAGTKLSADEAEVRSSCTSARVYYVVLRSGECTAIEGNRGRWLPEPTFEDAPPEVQRSMCTYRWVGEKYSRADKDALTRRVGYDASYAPACGVTGTLPSGANATSIPSFDVTGMAGSVGCDVCGIVKQDRMWAVLPDRLDRRQLQVRLSNGESRYYELGATRSRAVSLELPPLPAGVTYAEGPIGIY